MLDSNFKIDFLESRGWHTWYHHDYWVHKKLVKDPTRQDYTNYGMNTDQAYEFEMETPDHKFSGSFLGLRF